MATFTAKDSVKEISEKSPSLEDDFKPHSISKRDRFIVVLLALSAFIVLFRPMIADLTARRGDDYLHVDQGNATARAYSKALFLDPGNSDLHFKAGFADRRLGRMREAINHYSQAVNLRPESKDYRFSLALLLIQDNDLSGAINQLEEARQLGPEDFNIYRTLAITYSRAGKKDKALEVAAKMRTIFRKQAESGSEIDKIERKIQ